MKRSGLFYSGWVLMLSGIAISPICFPYNLPIGIFGVGLIIFNKD